MPVRGRPFEKGQSGNPGGRPKAVLEIQELCRALTPKGVKRLEAIIDSDDAPHAAQVAAVREIFDRAWGKAPQAITGEGGEGPAQVLLKIITGVPRADGDD